MKRGILIIAILVMSSLVLAVPQTNYPATYDSESGCNPDEQGVKMVGKCFDCGVKDKLCINAFGIDCETPDPDCECGVKDDMCMNNLIDCDTYDPDCDLCGIDDGKCIVGCKPLDIDCERIKNQNTTQPAPKPMSLKLKIAGIGLLGVILLLHIGHKILPKSTKKKVVVKRGKKRKR